MTLLKKLQKSLPKGSKHATMDASTFSNKVVVAHTDIPIMNMMLSSKLDGGVISGITQIVGDSRTFKSLFCLVAMGAYLREHKDAVAVFFDSEFGVTEDNFITCGVDTSRVMHVPVESVEDLKIKIVNMFNEMDDDTKVFMFVDSISQLPSNKEIDDAENGEVKVDMTRAKAINSLFRIITPRVNLQQVPFFVINSYYDNITNQYAEKNIKGGKQAFLSSDTILMVTRSQEKGLVDGKKSLLGWNFNYNVMKSRWVQEKSKFTITVKYDTGIDKWSGLMDLARDGGFVEMPSNGFYVRTGKSDGLVDDKKYRIKECTGGEFWNPVIESENFKKYVTDAYSYTSTSSDDEV